MKHGSRRKIAQRIPGCLLAALLVVAAPSAAQVMGVTPSRPLLQPAPLTYVYGRATFAAGVAPVAIADGDLDGNGIVDLVTADNGGNTVSVLLGKGHGAFHAPDHYATGTAPDALAIADLDGDGAPDLVVVSQNCVSGACSPGTVSVLLGDGAGGFAAPVNHAVNTNPQSVTVGDFDGDGAPDLAVVNAISTITQGPGTVSILLGSGDGSFGPGTEYAAGSGPGHVRAADFDGDGLLDLAITNYVGLAVTHAIVTLHGKGDGSFGPPVAHDVANGPTGLEVADLDADGALDLVTAGLGSNVASILFGDGAGGFLAHVDLAAGFGPKSIAVADLDTDGALDLALTTFTGFAGGGSVVILRGHGDGGFDPAVESMTGPIGPDLVADDIDGDGAPDLAAPDLGGAVRVLLGRGDGTLVTPDVYVSGSSPAGVARADFNGDGRPDLALVNAGANTFSVLPGLGAGLFGPKVDFAAGTEPLAIVTGDFDHDGKADVGLVNAGAGNVAILLGRGNGAFKPAKTFATGAAPQALVTGDFNGDGRLDVAVAALGNNKVALLLGNGDGTLQAKLDAAAGPGPAALAPADFNGDGQLDLAVADVNTSFQGPGKVSVLLGHGDGSFDAPLTYNAGIGAAAVAAGDFDGDGHADLAVATNLDVFGFVAVLLGHGDGGFEPQVTYGVGRLAVAIGVADFDRDHRPDLVVLNQQDNTATILGGRGDGTFTLQARYDAGPGPTAFVSGEFDADGARDLAIVNLFDEIRVFVSGR